MYSTRPIDALSNKGAWLGSYRFEPFLKKWFLVTPDLAARVVLLNEEDLPRPVLEAADRDETEWAAAAYRAPLKVQIQLNRNCNYDCPICYASSVRGKAKEIDLRLDELRALFSYLKTWGVLRVNFVGGEVFMRSDFEEIVQSAHNERLLVSCITNARIPGTAIDRFQNVLGRMWNVQISCNGVGKSYEEEYQTDSWIKASHCIQNVITATRRNILSYVITGKNLEDIPKFLEFAATANPSVVKFGTVCWSGRSLEDGRREYYKDIIPQAKQLIEQGRIRYAHLKIQSQIDLGEETPMWEEYINGYRPFEFYYAPEGRDGMYIHASGDVYPFPLLSDRPEFMLGNIRTNDLKNIWENDSLLASIRQVSFDNSDCGKLGCKNVCGLWSRSYAIAWSGRLGGKVPCQLTNWQ